MNYKIYSIVPFERERDQWRATIRRLDGRKIRVAVSYVTTSADTLTSEAAIDLAKQGIDRHSRMPAGPPARRAAAGIGRHQDAPKPNPRQRSSKGHPANKPA
jgi:hypothetical protein